MNGTKAYRAVYPSIKSDDVAGAAAARLLGNVRVQARIAEIMRAGAERAEVTVEQVVRELKLIGRAEISGTSGSAQKGAGKHRGTEVKKAHYLTVQH